MTRAFAAPGLLFAVLTVVGLGGLTPPAPQAHAADPPSEFFFKPGDRIVFLGDSITEQYQYSTDIELYLTTRFPTGNFTFLNAGIGGDTANGGAGRFQNHVLAEKPTAVTINFGMNDAGYGAFNPQANKTYVEKTAAMLEAAKKAGVRVALLSPNAVDRRVQEKFKLYLDTQKQFYAPLNELADKHGAAFVDQYAVTRAALEKMEADDPKAQKAKPFGDGFHTSSPGGLLMAHAILTGLKAPALVSDVTIDLSKGMTVEAVEVKGCTAMGTGGGLRPDGVTFTRTDEALPLPVQKDWLPMLPYTNDLKDLNYYGLTVKGLKDDEYTLSIDDTEVGRYTAKQLAGGVNLGNLTSGPIWEQANKVLQAINEKNRIVHGRFRGVILNGDQYWNTAVGQKRKPEELALRLEQAKEAQAKVYELARPKPRKFEIKPAR
jgi:lysophospholipase L1-like esterase